MRRREKDFSSLSPRKRDKGRRIATMYMKEGVVPQAGDYLVPTGGRYDLYRPRKPGESLAGSSCYPSYLGVVTSVLVPDPEKFDWIGHTDVWVGVWDELREVLVPLGLWVEEEASSGDRYKLVAVVNP